MACTASSGFFTFFFAALITAIKTQETFDWEQCGVSLICIRDPPGCISDRECLMAAAVSEGDPGYVRVRMMARNNGTRPYIAIRTSNDYSPIYSTTVICSPRDGSVRFTYNNNGYVDFANEETSEAISRYANSSMSDGIVRCVFERIIKPKDEMLVAQPFDVPQFVRISYGTIGDDGYPMNPLDVFVPPHPINFDFGFPIVTDPTPQIATVEVTPIALGGEEEEIPANELRSIPEIDESDVAVIESTMTSTLTTDMEEDSEMSTPTSTLNDSVNIVDEGKLPEGDNFKEEALVLNEDDSVLQSQEEEVGENLLVGPRPRVDGNGAQMRAAEAHDENVDHRAIGSVSSFDDLFNSTSGNYSESLAANATIDYSLLNATISGGFGLKLSMSALPLLVPLVAFL